MRLHLAFWAILIVLTATACAQPTPCHTAPADYSGLCYYGALPSFFDDFAYSSARTQGRVQEAPEGDLFGANTWHIRKGTEHTRAWSRYNRGDLSIPGSITFAEPSTMTLQFPEGLAGTDYLRDAVIQTRFTAKGGTYVWRVQLSELWEGQRVRQAAWTMSNSSYTFERIGPSDTTRTTYWSELDFENENQFQGEVRDGVFQPDYVTRMSVGNHYGYFERPGHNRRRLSADGLVPGEQGRGTLARNGPGRGAARETPLLSSWANTWLYLLIEVDKEDRSANYRMIPERSDGALRVLMEEQVSVGADFYPLQPMHSALSLHWIRPEDSLRHPLSLTADWFYFSPVLGLTPDEIREQVNHLRQQSISRLNTTGHPTFQAYTADQPIEPFVEGPRQVACGDAASWKLGVQRLGQYHVTYRYRILRSKGSPGPWQDVFTPFFSLTPQRGQAGVEIEVTAQDLWESHGITQGETGWTYPNPANTKEGAQFTAQFACTTR